MAVSVINVLVVDNYDSFTYNIAQIIRSYPGSNLQIIEAGRIDINSIDEFDRIIFSPGPDLPRPGNVMEKILDKFSEKKSVLGICLGLQAITLYFGGRLKQLGEVNHGRRKSISQTGNYSRMLSGIPSPFDAGLYHSWIADHDYLPDSLKITALSDDGIIMGIRHQIYDIEAVQFHPESIMTPFGEAMIQNWLRGL